DAVWDQQYMIAFDTGNNGAGIDPIYLYEGDPIVLPDAPTKMGPDNKAYQFDGWLYEGMEMPFVEMPQMDLILVAKWKLGVAIMFETDSDTELDPLFEEPGKNIIAPQIIPEKDGYIFTGWSLDGKPYIFKKMPEMTMTLTAEWIPTSNPYNTESTLPKVFINLKDNKPLGDVIREEYVDASITISNTDEDYELVSLRAEFKGRGNGSWWDSGPKKGYRIKFDKKQSV